MATASRAPLAEHLAQDLIGLAQQARLVACFYVPRLVQIAVRGHFEPGLRRSREPFRDGIARRTRDEESARHVLALQHLDEPRDAAARE
jgi:hypothetical protein